jgi:hypothetical protein
MMGLFGRKQSKMNNAAAGVLPRPDIQPGPTTIHNHSTGWASIIAVSVACAVALLPVFWFILVFLFDRMGYADPEREAAFWVVFIPFVFLADWLAKWLVLAIVDSLFGFLLEVEQEKTKRESIRLQVVQTTLDPGRMNEEDYQFAKVILAVMMTAYDWQEKNNYTSFPGRWRPWSLSSSLDTANEIGVKFTRDRANEVSKWLHKRGVITSPDGGQITAKYPDLGSVRAMLDGEYGRPIQVVLSPSVSNRGYEHI